MIILVGAHGTGKTTLLKRLGEVRKDLYITDGFSRPINIICDTYPYISKQQKQFMINTLTEWNWIQNINRVHYASTRSVIDSHIYSKVLGYENLAEKSLSVFKQHKNDDIKYFYIPIEFSIEADGVRSTDLNYQERIDREMLSFLKEQSINYITLSGDVEKRLSTLLTHIVQL